MNSFNPLEDVAYAFPCIQKKETHVLYAIRVKVVKALDLITIARLAITSSCVSSPGLASKNTTRPSLNEIFKM